MLLVSQKFQMLFSSTYFYCISLYFASQKLGLLQIEAKTLQQQKEYDSLYCGGLEPNPCYLHDTPM